MTPPIRATVVSRRDVAARDLTVIKPSALPWSLGAGMTAYLCGSCGALLVTGLHSPLQYIGTVVECHCRALCHLRPSGS